VIDSGIVEKAAVLGISHEFVNPVFYTRDDYDALLTEILLKNKIDAIILLGYMRICSAAFTQTWSGRLINVHPSLLPKHAGLMDLAVHASVIAAGDTVSGCTVHEVITAVDAGKILVQLQCPVLSTDTPETLKTRVQQLEVPALVKAVKFWIK
jgi:phosphoribosylglycinamide formyltransferase-1